MFAVVVLKLIFSQFLLLASDVFFCAVAACALTVIQTEILFGLA